MEELHCIKISVYHANVCISSKLCGSEKSRLQKCNSRLPEICVVNNSQQFVPTRGLSNTACSSGKTAVGIVILCVNRTVFWMITINQIHYLIFHVQVLKHVV